MPLCEWAPWRAVEIWHGSWGGNQRFKKLGYPWGPVAAASTSPEGVADQRGPAHSLPGDEQHPDC